MPSLRRGHIPQVHRRVSSRADTGSSTGSVAAAGRMTCPHSTRGRSLASRVESFTRGGLAGKLSPASMRSAVDSAQEISPLTSMPCGGSALHGLIRSAARRSSLAAPTVLPRWAWVMPTANCARPRHRSRSADGAAFHVPSRTSCAWNARPLSSRLCASANDWSGGRAKSSGGGSTPSVPLASGRPSSSRGRAFRARPVASRSRSPAMFQHLEWRQVPGEPAGARMRGTRPRNRRT
jgi:hypothetical protein